METSVYNIPQKNLAETKYNSKSLDMTNGDDLYAVDPDVKRTSYQKGEHVREIIVDNFTIKS